MVHLNVPMDINGSQCMPATRQMSVSWTNVRTDVCWLNFMSTIYMSKAVSSSNRYHPHYITSVLLRVDRLYKIQLENVFLHKIQNVTTN
jgi:hypothetical protein